MAELPKQPRIHASFWFENGQAQGEMVLMSEDRKLVHRQRYGMNPGDTMAKVHAVLLSVAGQAAVNAGAVPPPTAAPAAPSSSSSSSDTKPPPAKTGPEAPIARANIPAAPRARIAPGVQETAPIRPLKKD